MKKILFLLFIIVFELFAQNRSLFNEDLIKKDFKHLLSQGIDFSTRFLYKQECNNYNYISKNSKFKIYFDNTIDEDGHLKTSLSLRAKVKLPKINNNLFFTLDKESTQSQENRDKSEIRDLASDNNTRVGLKYYFKKTNNTKIYTKLGAKLRLSNQSDIYLKAGATNLQKFDKFNLYSYANEYYYLFGKKFITQLGSNIIKKLNNKYTLSLDNEIRLETHKDYNLQNSLILQQHIDKKSILSYWCTLNSIYDTKLTADSISTNIKYQSMINDWIFYEISPSVIKSLKKEKKISKYLHINFGFIF